MDSFETLIASYFDERLPKNGAAELADLLENDSEKAARFVAEYEIDRLLKLRCAASEESRIETIMAQIQRETDPFVQSVVQALEHETPAVVGKVTSSWNWAGRLFARPAWTLFGTALVAFFICAGFFYFGTPSGKPRLVLTETDSVQVVRQGLVKQAHNGFALQAGDVVRLSGSNLATMAFPPEQTRITVYPSTELKLLSVSGGKCLHLERGRIEATVARQRPFSPMLVRTPNAEARVIGTKFSLHTRSNFTQLEVVQGKVRFTSALNGRAVNVSAEEHSVVAPNYELAALPQSGHILREYWTNYTGDFTVRLTAGQAGFPAPDGWDYLQRFQSKPLGQPLQFGERIRGYVLPPTSGLYRFALTAVHVGTALNLSRSEKPEDIVQVAYKFPNGGDGPGLDSVTPVPLRAGRKYYIEVVHESNGRDDDLTVTWQAPGRSPEIIPGEFLSPYPVTEREKK